MAINHKVSCSLQMSQSPTASCICGASRDEVTSFTAADRELLAELADSQLLLVDTLREFMAAQVLISRSVVKLAEVVASLSLTSPRE